MQTVLALIPPENNRRSSGGLRIKVDVLTEVFEASRSSTHKVVPGLFVKTVGAHVWIGFLVHQHMKDTRSHFKTLRKVRRAHAR
jgi:hypothetical protein